MIKILFLCKGPLDKAIPIISIAQKFNAKDFVVEIICGAISIDLRKELIDEGINIVSLDLEEKDNANKLFSLFNKLYYWVTFRNRIKKMLKTITFDLLYVATADTAIALRYIIERRKYILHLREFHDEHPHYMKLLRKPAHEAYKVVVPEENRAYLCYNYLDLKLIPTVIPNKPFYHPRVAKMNITFLEPEVRYKIINKKNIIYQGPLHIERNLEALIKASLKLKDYNIVLMGKDFGMLNVYRKINPEIIHIPFIRPPLHLNITSWAHIGVITYDLCSLNTIYCAPNKIWEFSGFSIPILGNVNPGIKYTIGQAKAGVIVNFNNKDEIIKGIRAIEDNYAQIQMYAKLFYESVNTDGISQLI
jgi:hypothetical protein